MTTLYGTSLPPGLESTTKGELRIRIDKLILDDEALNNNPLLQASFAQSRRNSISEVKSRTNSKNVSNKNSITNSNQVNNVRRGNHVNSSSISSSTGSIGTSSNNFINKRKFCVPVDYCSLSPHFWGEAKPSASCIPATPRQLQRGAVTIIYLVKVKESAFAEYLHNMTYSSHRGLHLDVFVPSSYSGRKPVFVGQCVIDLDELSATKHLDGWFTLIHNTSVNLTELCNSSNSSCENNQKVSATRDSADDNVQNAQVHDGLPSICTSIPVGRVKVSFQLIYFSKAPVRLLASKNKKKSNNRVSFVLPDKENELNKTTQEMRSNNNTPVRQTVHEHRNSAREGEYTSVKEEKRSETSSENNYVEHRERQNNEEFEEQEEQYEEPEKKQRQESQKRSNENNLTSKDEVTSNDQKFDSVNTSQRKAHSKEEKNKVEANGETNKNVNSEPITLPVSSSTPLSSSSSSFANTLDELLHKSKVLRDRMAQAITLDSKVRHSVKTAEQSRNISTSPINQTSNANRSTLEHKPVSHNTVIEMDSNSEGGSVNGANEDDDLLYSSEFSDEEDRLLQLSRQQTEDKCAAHTPTRETPTQSVKGNSHDHGEKPNSQATHVRLISSAQPKQLHVRDDAIPHHTAMSLPVDYMRRRHIMGCTLVELNFSNFSFAANTMTTNLSRLRINVKLSADITTSTPTAGPFSSFVHTLPLCQPSICLSFDIQSYSEDVSRLVIEFYKVSTVSASVRDTSARYRTHSLTSSSVSSNESSSLNSSSLEEPSPGKILVHTPRRYQHQHQQEHEQPRNNNARKQKHHRKRGQVEETKSNNHRLPSTQKTSFRDVLNEELLGLCIVGLYSQERTIALRDPVGDVVNVYAHLQLALREPIHASNSEGRKIHKDNNNTYFNSSNIVDSNPINNVVNNKKFNSTNAKYETSLSRNAQKDRDVMHLNHSVPEVHEEQEQLEYKKYNYNNSNNNNTDFAVSQRFNSNTTNNEVDRHRNVEMENQEEKHSFNVNNHQAHISELPLAHNKNKHVPSDKELKMDNYIGDEIDRSKNNGLEGNTEQFNHCIHRKHITQANQCIRLRVEIVNAQDIPLVFVEKKDSIQHHEMRTTFNHQSTEAKPHEESVHYTKPNTFCVIEDVFMRNKMDYCNGQNGHGGNYQLDYSSPVEDWFVESYTNGYYDRSAVIWRNQRPQYNYSCVITVIHSNETYNSGKGIAENNRTSSKVHYSSADLTKDDSNILSDLHELRLTLWHCALPLQSTTHHKSRKSFSYAERDMATNVDKPHENFNKSIMSFDPSNETQFWAHSGELGECRIDLLPLRYLSTLDGYYPIAAKTRNSNKDILKCGAYESTAE